MSLPPEIEKYQAKYASRVAKSNAETPMGSNDELWELDKRAKEVAQRWKQEYGDPCPIAPDHLRPLLGVKVDWEAAMDRAGYTLGKFGSKSEKKDE